MKRTLGLLLCLGAWGCDDPLKSVELVESPRVLGARVEVEGDPERAAPAPGESATVRFLVASPELSPSLGFALWACPAKPGDGARVACSGKAFASAHRKNGAADAALSFDVPADLDPQGRVAILGVVCPDSSPSADGRSCEGDAQGTPVQLELELARDGDVNQNPELLPQSLSFDRQAWPELESIAEDCAGLGLPEVAPGSRHELGVALEESDRDPLPHPSKLDPLRESLQLSHFATAGDLTRAFESIAWDSTALDRRVEWHAPESPQLVRFWFVLRDFRGGGAFVERAVCVK